MRRIITLLCTALLAITMDLKWPIKPNPVMSVQALTPTLTIASQAARFNVAIVETASFKTSAGEFPCLQPVVMMPVPMGLVSTRESPGCAPALAGWVA